MTESLEEKISMKLIESLDLKPRETYDPENRYKIAKEIGIGGFSKVYRANDQRIKGRNVAIKLIFPKEEGLLNSSRAPLMYEHKDQIEFWQDEINAMIDLNIDGVANINDTFIIKKDSKKYFAIVEEYVDGRTLEDIIKNEKLSFKQKLDYMIEITKIVEKIHKRGYAHNDLNSGNIKITSKNEVKILDLAFAKKIGEGVDILMGSRTCTAHERYKLGKQSEKSDNWSLGVLFYEILTGGKNIFEDILCNYYRYDKNREHWKNDVEKLVENLDIKKGPSNFRKISLSPFRWLNPFYYLNKSKYSFNYLVKRAIESLFPFNYPIIKYAPGMSLENIKLERIIKDCFKLNHKKRHDMTELDDRLREIRGDSKRSLKEEKFGIVVFLAIIALSFGYLFYNISTTLQNERKEYKITKHYEKLVPKAYLENLKIKEIFPKQVNNIPPNKALLIFSNRDRNKKDFTIKDLFVLSKDLIKVSRIKEKDVEDYIPKPKTIFPLQIQKEKMRAYPEDFVKIWLKKTNSEKIYCISDHFNIKNLKKKKYRESLWSPNRKMIFHFINDKIFVTYLPENMEKNIGEIKTEELCLIYEKLRNLDISRSSIDPSDFVWCKDLGFCFSADKGIFYANFKFGRDLKIKDVYIKKIFDSNSHIRKYMTTSMTKNFVCIKDDDTLYLIKNFEKEEFQPELIRYHSRGLPNFSPDGKLLVFACTDRNGYDFDTWQTLDLFVYNIKTDKITRIKMKGEERVEGLIFNENIRPNPVISVYPKHESLVKLNKNTKSLECIIDGRYSYDLDGKIIAYSFDYGIFESGSFNVKNEDEIITTHSFKIDDLKKGIELSLNVYDNNEKKSSTKKLIDWEYLGLEDKK